MIIVILFIIFFTGWLTHYWFYRSVEEHYSIRTGRLLAYAIGLGVDIPLSWACMWAFHHRHGDRRKSPYPLERYILVRFLAAAALGLGVVLGYMLDRD